MTPAYDVLLNDRRPMPRLGLGVYQVPRAETARLVAKAIETGYRLIDTASLYGNEAEVGEGLRRAAAPLDEVFVTTKVWNDAHGYDATLRAFEASLERLALPAVDLLLIHWPVPRLNLYVESWRSLVRLRDEGRARSIGVSNFSADQIERLEGETGVLPAVNQIELHPHLQQRDLRDFHERRGIATQCWTPLGRAAAFAEPTIQAAAARHGLTPAQVVLRWHLSIGCHPIPRTVRPDRLAENLAARDGTLPAEDLQTIASLDSGCRFGPDPENFG